MKVIVKENLGADYVGSIISSCNQNGIQAIADYTGNEILFYDPKNWLYCRHSDMIKDASLDGDIFDLFNGKNPEFKKQVMKPTKGPDFEKFAVEWNALQRQEDPDIIKTKNCSMIRVKGDNGVSESRKPKTWKKIGKPKKDDGLSQDDLDFLDKLKNTDDKFGRRVNGIEARVSEGFDDSDDWSATEDEVEVQWMIDDKELGIKSGSTETVVIDLGLVDCFEELVYQVTNALEKEYGMPFDYDDEWILVDEDNLLKRFGYNMNESGSNGCTIDVTLKFTNGHYGKNLKAGDERTIKLDTSTAPTIYDQDDMLTWIADVASDQVPGGGCFTKYDFETIDPPDDVLIKAVMGDEGFGPDVDVDFEDFEPEDVPSEISYKDALKFYKKMHDAYDDRKLDYTKYDKIRKRLMDAIVKGLLKEKSLDELADEWFINYGTMNGWGWKTSFKYNVACALHDLHKKKHPDEHVSDREDTIRGWHSEKCSCGLASSCDSSD